MMQIPQRLSDIYRHGKIGLSIEIFPPKSPEGDDSLRQTLSQLSRWHPDFISCTYGAGGSTNKRTLEWCQEIQKNWGITATAHFTCWGRPAQELLSWLREADALRVRNIMALRGDPPFHPPLTIHPQGLLHACQLVELIRTHFPGMGIGVAGYPEKHPEAQSLEEDLKRLREKVQAGADAVFTQLFYDNETFYRFRERADKLGIRVPIVPGIMPLTDFSRIERITQMCGATIPLDLRSQLERYQHDRDMQYRIGVDAAIEQCADLIAQGVSGIHFYVLNKSSACAAILQSIPILAERQKISMSV